MRLSLFVVCCLAALFSTTTVFADKALPDEALPPESQAIGGKSEPAKLVVRRQPHRVSRIVIPAKYIKGLSGDKVGSVSPLRSMVAGVALSCAIAGVFIAMRRRAWHPTVAAVLFAILATWAGAPAVADVASQEQDPSDHIIVEIVPEGDEIVLFKGLSFPKK